MNMSKMNFNGGVIINGQRITGSVRNVEVKNNKVFIDGEPLDTSGYTEKVLNIVVEGTVESVKTDNGDITVNGESGTVSTVNGDVKVRGNVSGSVSTVSGDVNVKGGVAGNASTVSGDIRR